MHWLGSAVKNAVPTCSSLAVWAANQAGQSAWCKQVACWRCLRACTHAPSCAPRPSCWIPVPGAGLPNPLFDPCASARVGAWFNRQDVQEALHAIQVWVGAPCAAHPCLCMQRAACLSYLHARLIIGGNSSTAAPSDAFLGLLSVTLTTSQCVSRCAAGRGGAQVEGVRCPGPHLLSRLAAHLHDPGSRGDGQGG